MNQFKKLPRFVGIAADKHYSKKKYIRNLLEHLRPGSVVVLVNGTDLQGYIRDYALLRTDLYVKEWSSEPFEDDTLALAKKVKLNDHMFLSYLKFFKGRLFIFPHEYPKDSRGEEVTYSGRMQNLIISSYLSEVPYDIIKESGE